MGAERPIHANSGRQKSWVYIVSMIDEHQLKSISDDELLCRLSELLQDSRRIEAELIAHIAEVDARRLYAPRASSLFTYCKEILHMSEHESFLRMTAARASRKHPVLLDMLVDGRLHLSGIKLLAPHLTEANRRDTMSRDRMCLEWRYRPDKTSTRCIPTGTLRERAGCASCSRYEASRTMYRIGFINGDKRTLPEASSG